MTDCSPETNTSPYKIESAFDDVLHVAATQHQEGRFAEARKLYEKALGIFPESPEANHNMGILTMQTGRGVVEALPYFRASWRADPSRQQHWLSYLKALVHAQALDEAERTYAEGIERGMHGPTVGMLIEHIFGVAAKRLQPASVHRSSKEQENALLDAYRQKDFFELEKRSRQWIETDSGNAFAWKALGVALLEQKRFQEALLPIENTIRLQPKDPESQNNLGRTCLTLGLLKKAEIAFLAAIKIKADYAMAHEGLAETLLGQHRLPQAKAACQRALAIDSQLPEALCTLGDILSAQGELDEAKASYQQSLLVRPKFFTPYQKLQTIYQDESAFAEMEALCRQVLSDSPTLFEAHADLGVSLNAQGRLAEGMKSLHKALELNATDIKVRASLLFCENYLSEKNADQLLDDARLFGVYATQKVLSPFSDWVCDPMPKRLKVGLLSGDLRRHPVGYFLESVLANTDAEKIEWVAYSTQPEVDDLTRRLQKHIGTWNVLVGFSDEQCAHRMHADGVHVLIDLSGHTLHNRLGAMAWRPAPVQISWLGYFATTGLAEMDYLLVDPVSVPAALRENFTEKIVYLPETRLCFTPPEEAPLLSSWPPVDKASITFGSFQALPKINDQVLGVWARILSDCPSARLRIQNAALGDEQIVTGFSHRLTAHGIDLSRVVLHGKVSRQDYLAAYAEVDILLDTFPYPGGTTTCEALWMGVPTIALRGTSMIANQGAGLLAAAGLNDWVAETLDDYVALAIKWANNMSELIQLRRKMRNRVQHSPLCDAPRFCRHLENTLWFLWAETGVPRVK
jgi:protein O-GlcNAc transferase